MIPSGREGRGAGRHGRPGPRRRARWRRRAGRPASAARGEPGRGGRRARPRSGRRARSPDLFLSIRRMPCSFSFGHKTMAEHRLNAGSGPKKGRSPLERRRARSAFRVGQHHRPAAAGGRHSRSRRLARLRLSCDGTRASRVRATGHSTKARAEAHGRVHSDQDLHRRGRGRKLLARGPRHVDQRHHAPRAVPRGRARGAPPEPQHAGPFADRRGSPVLRARHRYSQRPERRNHRSEVAAARREGPPQGIPASGNGHDDHRSGSAEAPRAVSRPATRTHRDGREARPHCKQHRRRGVARATARTRSSRDG